MNFFIVSAVYLVMASWLFYQHDPFGYFALLGGVLTGAAWIGNSAITGKFSQPQGLKRLIKLTGNNKHQLEHIVSEYKKQGFIVKTPLHRIWWWLWGLRYFVELAEWEDGCGPRF